MSKVLAHISQLDDQGTMHYNPEVQAAQDA